MFVDTTSNCEKAQKEENRTSSETTSKQVQYKTTSFLLRIATILIEGFGHRQPTTSMARKNFSTERHTTEKAADPKHLCTEALLRY